MVEIAFLESIRRRGILFVALLVVGGLLFLALTFSVTIRMNVITFVMILLVGSFLIYVTFMTSVKFHSPLVVGEDGVALSTFDSRAEVVYDRDWDMSLGVVFHGGFNAPKRVFSKQDVEKIGDAPGKAALLVTSSPFMIESLAEGRFLVIRGTPRAANDRESAAFLSRPSILEAFGEEVRTAKVYFVFSSKTLHPDSIPEDALTLGDLSGLMQSWRSEIATTVDMFNEEFTRKLQTVKALREGPLERMARERTWRTQSEEVTRP